MQRFNNFSNDADQLVTFPLEDGTSIQIELIFRPGIERWMMNLTHPLLNLKGFNLSVGPNILRSWKNIVPFGIAILSNNGLDPIRSDDFQEGIVTFNMLSEEEVAQVEAEVLVPDPLVFP